MTPEFNYESLDAEAFRAALEVDRRVVIVLRPFRGRVLVSLVRTLGKIRTLSKRRRSISKVLGVLTAGTFMILVSCVTALLSPKLMELFSFFVLEKPHCSVSKRNGGYRFQFSRE